MAEQTLATTAKKWAREYETIYILRPTVDPEGAAKVAARVQEVMTKTSAKIIKVETWGVRRLAYSIAKHRRGIFVYVRYAGYGDVVAELERNLRLLEAVIRYQTIVLTEKTDLDAVEVSDETTFDAIEQLEDEPELTTAQQLGMEERRPRNSNDGDSRGGDSSDGDSSDGDSDGDDVTAEAAADDADGESSGDGAKASEEE